ncbi:acyltransferase [Phenylobacterium terrae]|uniref:Acyltransferase n=1 Tax=Phenylobacterium terrae TaxID=2665495 RepID=A0ABW4N0F8_9CAUL
MSTRRHDLDALRVGAFMLLILYHLGMFYVPWGWHVKSSHIVPELQPLMEVVNPWRLTLLFVISGAATRFMADRLATGRMFKERSARLLVPLLFGMAVIVAPQSWAEVVEKNGYAGSFLDFWPRYLSFDQSFGIILPTYNHLWFVAYLWVYTAAALALRPWWDRLDAVIARIGGFPALLIVAAAVFALIEATAGRAWGETHIVFADGYGHLHYGLAFFIGLSMARLDAAWEGLERGRWISLALAAAVAAPGLYIGLSGLDERHAAARLADDLIHATYAWAVICALFGFARRHIRRGSKTLTMLTEAVFPFYIVHQTTIVMAGHVLKPYGLPVLAEAGLILAATAASCWLAYDLARRIPLLRLPMGLKPIPRARPERDAAKLVTPA